MKVKVLEEKLNSVVKNGYTIECVQHSKTETIVDEYRSRNDEGIILRQTYAGEIEVWAKASNSTERLFIIDPPYDVVKSWNVNLDSFVKVYDALGLADYIAMLKIINEYISEKQSALHKEE